MRLPFAWALAAALLLLMAVHGPAAAQTAAPVVAAKPDPFQCAPSPFGQGTRPVYRISDEGAFAAWWCTDGFEVRYRVFVVHREAMTAEWTAALAALRDSSNVALAIQQMADRFAKIKIDDPLVFDLWAPYASEIDATRPALPKYLVAVNGLSANRPLWLLKPDGTRDGKQAVERATVGATCACKVRVVEGSSVYCSVPPASVGVALCRPEP